LMAAGHLGSQPTAPVEASFPPPSQPEVEPSPELIAALQQRIAELEDVVGVDRSDGPFKAQKLAMAVAKKHGLKYSDLKSPRRQNHLVRARQEAMWLIRKECPGLSLPAIGRLFGGKDHTTVLHACRVHAKRVAE
jgi:chromosomal replication initiation ATPase DnaA